MKNAALILAKEGSIGLPKKNIIKWRGQPLLWHTIQDCQHADVFDQVFVSTNGQEIARIAEKAGAQVIMRPDEYAHNSKYVDSVNHAVKHIASLTPPATITIPMVVQPVREDNIFQRILSLHSPQVDSVVTVGRISGSLDWIYERDEKSQQLQKSRKITYGSEIARQSNLFFIDNAITSFTYQSWQKSDGLTPWPYLGRKIIAIEQNYPNSHLAIDINTPEDAEWLYFVDSFSEWQQSHHHNIQAI